MIQTRCRECAQTVRVPDEAVGKKARCPRCQAVFVVAREPPPAEDAQNGIVPADRVAPAAADEPSRSKRAREAIQPAPKTSQKLREARPRRPEPARSHLVLWIGAVAAVVLVAAGLAGWFLWRSGGDDFGRRQQADNPVQPNGGPQKRVKVPTEPIVARLKKVAAIQANDAGVTMELEDLLFLVQAVGGAEEAAFEAIKSAHPEQQAFLGKLVQQGQLRAGHENEAAGTAKRMCAVLDDNRRPLDQAVLWTAEACARVKDHDGVREVLNHKAIANKEEVRRDIVMKVLQIQSEIGDAKGAEATGQLLPQGYRIAARFALLNIRLSPGMLETGPEGPKPLAVDFYRQLLRDLVDVKISASNQNRDLGETAAMVAATRCLLGLCRHGKFAEAGEHALAFPLTHPNRQGWISAIALVQAQAGDAAGAFAMAQKAGYLLLTAQLQIDAGQLEEAAKSLRILLLALDADPPGAGRLVLNRARLLRRLAVLQFRAGKPDEGTMTVHKGLELAGSLKRGDTQDIDGRDSRYKSDVIVELEATELEVAAAQVTAGNLEAALKTAEKYAEDAQVRGALSRLWSKIGAAQWKAGDQEAARASFKKASAAAPKVNRERRVDDSLRMLVADRIAAGDLSGASETLALTEVEDATLGDMAVAQVKAGKLADALTTIGKVKAYTMRHGALLIRIGLAQAERGDLEAGFLTYFDNVRTVGEPTVPVALFLKAAEAGRLDLLLRHLNTIEVKLLRELAEPFIKAGKPRDAQRLTERALELAMAQERDPQRKHLLVTPQQLRAIVLLLGEQAGTERVKELLPMMKDLWLTARYGDLDQAIAMLKADQDAKMPLADPRFGFEEPGPRGIYLIMHAVASEIVPPEALQELAARRDFRRQPFFREDMPLHESRPFDPLTKLFHEYAPTFPTSEEFTDVDMSRAPKEPHLEPDVIARLAPRAQTAPKLDSLKETGSKRWSVSPVSDEPAPSVAVVVVQGEPMIFTTALHKPDRPNGIFLLKRKGKEWFKELIVQPEAGSYFGSVSAVASGAKIYLAINTHKGNEASRGLEILTLTDGKWVSEFQTSNRGGHYGGRLCFRVVDGRPMAVFTGQYPASGAYSHNAQFLERAADGKWKEIRLPVPYNAGIFEFGLTQVGKEPAVAFCTYGGSGLFHGQRADDKWTFGRFGGRTHDLDLAMTADGLSAAASTEDGLIFWKYQDGKWAPLPLALPKSRLQSSHFATIGGKLSFACYEGNSATLHLFTLDAGTWVDQVLPMALPENITLVRLFEWDGRPALLLKTAQALVVARPPVDPGK